MDESTPLLPDSPHQLSRHQKAAWIVDEITRGSIIRSADDVPSTRRARSAYLLFVNTTWLRQTAVVLLILLSFFELPSWCSPHHSCQTPDGSSAFMSGISYLSSTSSILINASLLSILIFFFFLDMYYGAMHMHDHGRLLARLLIALVLDFFYVAAFSGYPPIRIASFLRVLLPLFYWPNFRECTMSIVSVIEPFFDVVFFVILFTLLFAWVVTLFFHDVPEADFYFGDLLTGIYSAFTSLTTADWPMQIMAILDVSRISALLFIAFIVIGVFLLFNVLLAVVYNAYTGHIEELVVNKLRARRESLLVAYDVLCDNGNEDEHTIALPDVTLMFHELRKNKRHSHLSDDSIDMVFTALDDDADQVLNRDEFLDVVDVLHLKFVVELESPSPVETYFPQFYASDTWQSISAYVKSDNFNYVVDAFMIFNVIVVIIETTLDLRDKDTPTSVLIFSLLECAFSVVYIAEMALKIASLGFHAYWRDAGNRFDFYVTWLLLFATTIVLLPIIENDSDIIKLFILLRCLRLFELLSDIPRFRRLVHVFSVLLPASLPLFSFLFMSLYVFAALGVEMFGGLIYAGNPALNPALVPTVDPYVSNDYWTLNFNDLASGWFVLFSSVIVAYLTEIASVISSASRFGEWTKWFFIASFVVNTLVVSNCVVAFVVDLFVEEDEKVENDEQDQGSSFVRDIQSRYGSRRVKVLVNKSTAHQVYANMFRERLDDIMGTVGEEEAS